MPIYIGSRYEGSSVVNLTGADGSRKNTVFRGPSPYVPERFYTYLVVDGDRIDRLADRFYGDANLWWVIADANQEVPLPDPLEPGTVLRIPDGRDIR